MSEPNDAGIVMRDACAGDLVPALAPADVYDPVIEAYKKDVDRTLIRENLKLTHEQRLVKLQSVVSSLLELRGAARRRSRSGEL